jgi:hypothetical protein
MVNIENILEWIKEKLFGKRFGLKKAKALVAIKKSGRKVDPATVATTLALMQIPNVVADEAAKETTGFSGRITGLDESTKDTLSETEEIKKAKLKQIEAIQKEIADAEAAAADKVAVNTAEKADLENKIKATMEVYEFA